MYPVDTWDEEHLEVALMPGGEKTWLRMSTDRSSVVVWTIEQWWAFSGELPGAASHFRAREPSHSGFPGGGPCTVLRRPTVRIEPGPVPGGHIGRTLRVAASHRYAHGMTAEKKAAAAAFRSLFPNPASSSARVLANMKAEGLTGGWDGNSDTGMGTLQMTWPDAMSLAMLLGQDVFDRLLSLRSTTVLEQTVFLLTDRQADELADAIEEAWRSAA